MAKKEDAISMVDTFTEFKELKNIDRTTMVSVLEESFRSVIAKMFGSDENYDVIVNPDKGDFEIWRNREVVADEDLTDPNKQISLSEAQKIDASYEVGEEVTDEVDFAKFGRRAILNLRQTLASKILELEKDSLYNKYIDKVGTIISAEVYQIWKKEILLLDDDGNELFSCNACWSRKCRKSTMALLPSRRLPASLVSVPRLRWKVMMTALTR